ncbi:MAG: D-alanine--D-alanine ligase [Proteobacteria bacterium]|nr:D-alanine--D-alanine ligase [Pseudomonadota bacterium]NCA28976.1 D-alanine--D-alanine ligase [Pseudomonadota bacterium]
MKSKKILVLCGGWNSEREVSLRSGESVYQALIKMGYNATKVDFTHQIINDLKQYAPDLVFNALHGQYGEDGRIQGLLDILEIPYTHSGVLASAVCMDKVMTRKLCQIEGVLSPQYEILHKNSADLNKQKFFKIGKPCVIKPINEGSSIGVEVIMPNSKFDITDFSWQYGDEMILENYIAGQEVHVAVMDGKALGAIEVRPHGLFYDYKCKYTQGMTDYIMPAEISAEKYQEVLNQAEKCFNAVGCRGIARVDFILNNKNSGDNKFYLLEVNTHPGFTATSLVPKIAQHVGISFEQIVDFLVKNAYFG